MVRQNGFSLIEALIALVILAFGLIGVAAMQITALQSASAGYTVASERRSGRCPRADMGSAFLVPRLWHDSVNHY